MATPISALSAPISADPKALAAAIGGDADADIIVHLAAQAGVRYSVENPAAYVDANVHGQVTVFEQALQNAEAAACRVCQFFIGLRRQYEGAIFGKRSGRSSRFGIRCDQALG